jgi:Rps23 Pro-64 3,4-dihydroxylase Tpa1-like proline 4-hydroxylase
MRMPVIAEAHDARGAGLSTLTSTKIKAAWRWARPVPYVVLDNLLDEESRRDLVAGFFDETAQELHTESYSVLASPSPPQQPALRALHDGFAATETLAAVSALTGEDVVRIRSRAFVFQPGHFLLPHPSQEPAGRRAVAFAYCIDASMDLEGGDVWVYERSEINPADPFVETEPHTVVAARSNRLLLAAVSEDSIHEVREVVRGCRLSLTGWFYR